MRNNAIRLKKNKEHVIIDLDSKVKCANCHKEIFSAVEKGKRIIIGLVGLAEWDRHVCGEA